MPVRVTDEAIAEQVVVISKAEANVETGRLRRSINQKVQRGIIVFREYYYGQYGDNSTLEKNAKEMMGVIPYKIERLDEEGNIVEGLNKASSGRVLRYERIVKREKKIDLQLQLRLRERREKENESDENN